MAQQKKKGKRVSFVRNIDSLSFSSSYFLCSLSVPLFACYFASATRCFSLCAVMLFIHISLSCSPCSYPLQHDAAKNGFSGFRFDPPFVCVVCARVSRGWGWKILSDRNLCFSVAASHICVCFSGEFPLRILLRESIKR
jgi:hypothetical protein